MTRKKPENMTDEERAQAQAAAARVIRGAIGAFADNLVAGLEKGQAFNRERIAVSENVDEVTMRIGALGAIDGAIRGIRKLQEGVVV